MKRWLRYLGRGVLLAVVFGVLYTLLSPETYISMCDYHSPRDERRFAQRQLRRMGRFSVHPMLDFIAKNAWDARRTGALYEVLRGMGAPAHEEWLRQIALSHGKRKMNLVMGLQECFHDFSYLPWALAYVQEKDAAGYSGYGSELGLSLVFSYQQSWAEGNPDVCRSEGCDYEFVLWYQVMAKKGIFPPIRFKEQGDYFAMEYEGRWLPKAVTH